MSEEETNQTQPDETNAAAPTMPSGETGASGEQQGESQAGATESGILSPEEIAELRQQAESYRELQPAFTRATQDLAETRRQNEQYQQAIQGFIGQQAAQNDPVEAAWQQYAEAKATYDNDAESKALRAAIGLERQQAARDAAQQAVQTMRVERGLNTLGDQYGPVSAEELTELRRTMTPEDELKALALLRLEKQGKLSDTLTAGQRRADEKAQEAMRLKSLLGGSGGRQVPGSLNHESEGPISVPASIYYGVSKASAEKRWPNATITPG